MLILVTLLLFAQSETTVQRSQRAKQALLSGRSAEAVQLYRQLVDEIPGDPGLRLNLALALESAGDYSAEILALQAVVKARPNLASAWLMMGMAHQKLSQPAEAEAPLLRALAIEPANRIALLELGDVYLSTGKPGEAVRRFKTLVQLEPKSAKGWQGLGLGYLGLSTGALAKLAKTAPVSAAYLMHSARLLMQEQQDAKAIVLLRQAVEMEPERAAIHVELAKLYTRAGQDDLAQSESAKAGLAKASKTSPSWDLLTLAETNGRLAQAAFAELEKLPETPEVHELLAEAAHKQGRRLDAVAEWRKAAALAPRDARIAARLAESLWANRSYEEAAEILKPLVAARPQAGHWQFLLGDTLFRLQQMEESLPHAMAAVRLQPQLIAAHALLGRLLMQLGEPAKAIEHLEKGCSVDDTAITYQLGQAYQATGQAELAEKAFARHRELLRKQAGEPAITPAVK